LLALNLAFCAASRWCSVPKHVEMRPSYVYVYINTVHLVGARN
jgi:hypothetical protein